jgi:riboflavin biosynthesis pyrimidine reductase
MRSLLPPEDRDLSDEDLEDLYASPGHGRHVRANFVMSLDGAIEVEGQTAALGSDDDHRVFATLRSLADVVLVGAETARREDYGPARLTPERRERRERRGQGRPPAIAVVTARGELDPQARLFSGGPDNPTPIVLTCEDADAQRRKALAEVADVVICGQHAVDPAVALSALRDRHLDRILCEGGPSLMTQLVAAGLVDELCLTLAPVLAGPGHKTLTAGLPFALPVSLRLERLLAGDDTLLACYRVVSRDLERTAS